MCERGGRLECGEEMGLELLLKLLHSMTIGGSTECPCAASSKGVLPLALHRCGTRLSYVCCAKAIIFGCALWLCPLCNVQLLPLHRDAVLE